jgi:hypothetical protein
MAGPGESIAPKSHLFHDVAPSWAEHRNAVVRRNVWMIDSQTQVRWLAAAAALIVFVIGPGLAGMTFGEATQTDFAIYDGRTWDESTLTSQKQMVATGHAIFLVRPVAGQSEAGCPGLEPNAVEMPMPTELDTTDALAALEGSCSDLAISPEHDAVLTQRPFSWPWAFTTGTLLLIGALLAVATLAARQPRRSAPVVRDPAPPPRPYRPPAPVVRETMPPPSPRLVAPPVLTLADLPGVREVVREQGATAKARSHIDGAGGYVVLGDVLMWATPAGGGVACPDDDVRVAVSVAVTPTLDGGLRP